MSTPRYGGSLVEWIEADGFGEIATAGHAPLPVYREELVRAGMMPPKIGARCTFEIGATHKGNTGAINVEKVPEVHLGKVQ